MKEGTDLRYTLTCVAARVQSVSRYPWRPRIHEVFMPAHKGVLDGDRAPCP